MFLTDLTFIEEGNPEKVGGLINFKKRLYVYNVLNEISSYQKVFFSFALVVCFCFCFVLSCFVFFPIFLHFNLTFP